MSAKDKAEANEFLREALEDAANRVLQPGGSTPDDARTLATNMLRMLAETQPRRVRIEVSDLGEGQAVLVSGARLTQRSKEALEDFIADPESKIVVIETEGEFAPTRATFARNDAGKVEVIAKTIECPSGRQHPIDFADAMVRMTKLAISSPNTEGLLDQVLGIEPDWIEGDRAFVREAWRLFTETQRE